MNKYYFFLSMIIILVSCKQKDNILKNKDLKTLSVDEVFDTISSKNFDYNTFYAKFNVKTSLSKIDAKGTLKLKKDSIIWVSLVPMLGFEAARISITQDTIKILDRLKKTYIYKDYSYMKTLTGIDISFSNLQSVLLNDFTIVQTTASSTKSNFEVGKNNSNNLFTISNKGDESDIKHKFTIDNTKLRIKEVKINDTKKQRFISIEYNNFEDETGILFPNLLNIIASNMKDSVTIEMEYKKLKINQEQEYNFSIPESYKHIH